MTTEILVGVAGTMTPEQTAGVTLAGSILASLASVRDSELSTLTLAVAD